MAGHMGDARVTTQNLDSVSTDAERGLILVQGAIPGAQAAGYGSRMPSRKSCRNDLPFPAAQVSGSRRRR